MLLEIYSYEFCKAKILTLHLPSRYDQTLYEDENKNRMMETKELFEWVLKQPCFEVFFYSFSILNSSIYICIGSFRINLFFFVLFSLMTINIRE